MDFPNTRSDSSAKMKMDLSPTPNDADNVITPMDAKTGILGDQPIKVTMRKASQIDESFAGNVTEDFGDDVETGQTQGFDGTKTSEPFVADPASKVTTEFSKR